MIFSELLYLYNFVFCKQFYKLYKMDINNEISFTEE